MSAAAVQLKRQATELREQAHTKLEALRGQIQKQMTGQLADGETRLSNEEIVNRKKEIEELIAQAKSVEGLDDLDAMMNRPESEMSPAAREIKQGLESRAQDAAGKGKGSAYFKSLGHFLRSVRATQGNYSGARLSEDQKAVLSHLHEQASRIDRGETLTVKELGDLDIKTLVGDDPGSSGRADYLVPPEHMTELLRLMGEQQQFAQRTRRVPMARRSVVFPRLVQTDATDTRPMFSFAAVAKVSEAAQKPEREPTFDQMTLTAVKYAAYLEASDELLVDSIIDLPPVLTTLMTDAIAYEYDRDTMRGTGVGEPLGVINSPAMLSIPRQNAGAVTIVDIFNLEAHFFGTDGIYLFHQSAIPQIYALQSNNLVAWTNDLTATVPGTLLGRPMVRTAKLPLLGNEGDFNLVDPSFYLTGEVQGITVANSIHYKFRNDVTAWRAVYRAAGAPWPGGTFTMEATAGVKDYEVSPFVNLAVPAAS